MALRALLWVGLYVVATGGMLGFGAWLVVAPASAGTFLNERYAVAPVPSSTVRRSGLRIAGVALMTLGLYFATRVVWPLLNLLFGR